MARAHGSAQRRHHRPRRPRQDHLVDRLLQQSGTFRANQQVAERALDWNDLERERGITILAKCTSVVWQGTRINIVDTPGHADFGGEVERILSMVDGVLLLVDAAEGPMPQTKFVLGKALRLGLRPIVVINKLDRPDQRAHGAQRGVRPVRGARRDRGAARFSDLVRLGARGLGGAGSRRAADGRHGALFELIRRHVPAPRVAADGPFVMLASTLERDPHLGRLLTGRIESGAIQPNATIQALGRDGGPIEQARVTKILAFRGLERVGLEEARAGDIVALAGFDRATVADTLCDLEVETALPAQPIDPPTLAMTFSANDRRSPARRAAAPPRACSVSGCGARPRATSRSGSPGRKPATASRWPGAASCSSRC